jgi:hypothetical protein
MQDLINPEKSKIRDSCIKLTVSKIYISRKIQIAYIVITLYTIFCIIWICINPSFQSSKNIWNELIIITELLLCNLIILDLTLRAYLTGFSNFLRNYLNIIDISMSLLCLIEIPIALLVFLNSISEETIQIAFLALRNFFMSIRVCIMIKRGIERKDIKPVVIQTLSSSSSPNLDYLLETNLENLKFIYRSRLDTLGEEDEVLESSTQNNPSVHRNSSIFTQSFRKEGSLLKMTSSRKSSIN